MKHYRNRKGQFVNKKDYLKELQSVCDIIENDMKKSSFNFIWEK